MYFGLTNSPATFQTMMNYIFQDTILKHELRGTTIRVYMDDIGIVTRMDPVKIAGIDTWPTPKNVTEVRRAVGFFNFYHPFIKGFAHIARPLHQLTRKNQEWKWGHNEQQAFDKLKKLVTEEPILTHPDLTQQFEVEVDALGYAVGATLVQ